MKKTQFVLEILGSKYMTQIHTTGTNRKEVEFEGDPPRTADHLGFLVADLLLQLVEGIRVLLGASRKSFPSSTLKLETRAA